MNSSLHSFFFRTHFSMGVQFSSPSSVEGFQVVHVKPETPAHRCGLLPYFDFILSVDDMPLDAENKHLFPAHIGRKVDNEEVDLKVYNLKVKQSRNVSLALGRSSSGQGEMGCSITWNSVENAEQCVWHVTSVASESAAAQAGILSERHFLLGMEILSLVEEKSRPMMLFSKPSDFRERLEKWSAQRIRLLPKCHEKSGKILFLVYDTITNTISEVCLVLQDISLGIDVGNGYMHSIPVSTQLPLLETFHENNRVDTSLPHVPESSSSSLADQPTYSDSFDNFRPTI